MQHYKSRKDDQLLQEVYSGIVEEKFGKVAASLGAAAALASGGCDGPNCKPKPKPVRSEIAANSNKKMSPIAQEAMRRHAEMRYAGELSKMFGGSVNLRYEVPVRNGRALLSLEELNSLRQKYNLRPIENDQYMAATGRY